MTSPVEIANLALGWLGKKALISFQDGTTEADLCLTNYPLARDAVTGRAEWTFTTKRFVLAKDVDGPVFGEENRFLIPEEVIRVFTVNGTYLNGAQYTNNTFSGTPWMIEGAYIHTTDQQANIRAAVRLEDSSVFSPEFVRSVAARLAADIAIPLTQSKGIEDAMEARYRRYLTDAMAQDGRQGATQKLRSEWLQRARWSGGGGFFGPTV